jgi:hypothetical protein
MSISEPKERVTVTLDPVIKKKLEKEVPKSERSRFVEAAIAKALDKMAKDEAIAAIRAFKRYPLKGPGVVETLREVRAERDEQLASRHKSRRAAE